MTISNFTTTLLVKQKPQQAFDAINNVRGWWSEEIEGSTSKVNDVFNYHYEDVHRCKIKIVAAIPAKKIVWLVLENYFKFTNNKNEWTGNKIIFDIAEQGGETAITMTQEGLGPQYECFDICQNAWTNYIQNSLRNLITTGEGLPNGKGKPQTENEKKLAADKK